VDFSPGLSGDIMKIMQHNHAKNDKMDRVCIVAFDEMAISPYISYYAKTDQIFGPCKKVQVLTVRGLFGKWKYPIYFNFDSKMSKQLLLDAIETLHAFEFIVKGELLIYFEVFQCQLDKLVIIFLSLF